MQKSIILVLILLSNSILIAQEQEPATEAGEDFDLYGVLGIFEESEDLEDFEKKINSEDNDVNNLDLNKDDEVDIVKVVEYAENKTHLLVLQVVLGDNDFQDIATIEIEEHSDGEISLQVIGDEDIYGPDYIIEPAPEEGSTKAYGTMAVFVSVRLWRPVKVIYRPGRIVFVSAVVFRPRPPWFRVRRPIARSSWRARARRWHSPRVRHTRARHSSRGRNMYSSRRRTSPGAKNNYGPKPGPNTGPSTSPSNQKKKSAATSPGGSTSPNQQQKKKTTSQQKRRKH